MNIRVIKAILLIVIICATSIQLISCNNHLKDNSISTSSINVNKTPTQPTMNSISDNNNSMLWSLIDESSQEHFNSTSYSIMLLCKFNP